MRLVVESAATLLVTWLILVAALLSVRPKGERLKEALRLLPDVLRLLSRLARDPQVPRGTRIRLWLLLGYLALPVDLVPDFVPVLGYADDAIIVSVTLRSIARRTRPDVIARHWPGTPDGLAALARLTGLTPPAAGVPTPQLDASVSDRP